MPVRCCRRRSLPRGRVTVWLRARRTGNAPTTSCPWPCRLFAPSNTDRQGTFMNSQNKLALLSALGGAAIAVTLMLAAATFGLFPQRLAGGQIRAYLLSHPEIL